jgi:uncharacterized protein YqjF (DUF2071 family)
MPLPWVFAQSWVDLLFAHWQVDADALRQHVPPALELEEAEGGAWLGVVPFRIEGFRARGTRPLPWLGRFPELNVRTYVRGPRGPGVWFFSLDAASRAAVRAARRFYRLPYFYAQMRVVSGEAIEYESSRGDLGFAASYGPAGEPAIGRPGSLEHFLTERYRLYAWGRRRLWCAEIDHEPWSLQPAAAQISLNTMAAPFVELPGEPLLHFARRQDALVWPLRAA